NKPLESMAIPLSIHPDPAYFVERSEHVLQKIVKLIETSDAGVLGITGVRGSGKSVILNKIAERFRERYHTIQISAPISASREMEFFIMLFRLLCDSVIVKLRQRVFSERFDLKAIGTRKFWKRLLSFILIAATCTVMAFYALYSFSFYSEKMFISNLLSRVDLTKHTEYMVRLHVDLVRNKLENIMSETNSEKRRQVSVYKNELAFLENIEQSATKIAVGPHPALAKENTLKMDAEEKRKSIKKAGKESTWKMSSEFSDIETKREMLSKIISNETQWSTISKAIRKAIEDRSAKMSALEQEFRSELELKLEVKKAEQAARKEIEKKSALFVQKRAKVAKASPNWVKLVMPAELIDVKVFYNLINVREFYNLMDVREFYSLIDVREFYEFEGARKFYEFEDAREFYEFEGAMDTGLGQLFRGLRAPLKSTPPLYFFVYFVLMGLTGWFLILTGQSCWRSLRYRRELGLLSASERLAQQLEYETTRSRSAEIAAPFVDRITGKLKLTQEQKSRPLSLPGLTAAYLTYINRILEVFPEKIIICIDELDKVSDVEHVRFILREIKGALYSRGCFYLLSVSEDAISAYERRFVGERDIFESTFDEVLSIDKLNLNACIEIIHKRLQDTSYNGRKPVPSIELAITIAGVLSSGIPRDLIRNLREIVVAAGDVQRLDPALAWATLFTRKVQEVRIRIKVAQAADKIRVELIEELDKMSVLENYDQNQCELTLSEIDKRICWLQDQRDGNGHEVNKQMEEGERKILGSWIKYWIELKIYHLVRLYSLMMEKKNSELARGVFENLLNAYAILPYSVETCQRRLTQLRAI
ncbi:hypothetical protein KA005_66115, partial [bacterium]|nr:hypothetical protein [bacterium]